jgi:hypothetical protein
VTQIVLEYGLLLIDIARAEIVRQRRKALHRND